MEKQQMIREISEESGVLMTDKQAEIRNFDNSKKTQLYELARLRIERNRAARHARCASLQWR